MLLHVRNINDAKVVRRKLRKIEERSARKYLIEQLRARGYSIKEIAQMLNVSRQTIYDDLNL